MGVTQAHFDAAITSLNTRLQIVQQHALDSSTYAQSKAIQDNVAALTTTVDGFKKEVVKTLQFQGAVELINALNASVGAIESAVYASRRGDTVGTAAYSLSAIATIVKGAGAASLIAGPEALPVAMILYILGGVIDLVASICEVFRKEEKSLIERIAELLVRARSKELREHLTVASDQLEKWDHALRAGTLQSMPWSEFVTRFDLRAGLAVTFIDVAGQWLLDPENRDVTESWVSVFEAYATCMYLRSMVHFTQYASWLRYKRERTEAIQNDQGEYKTDEASVRERALLVNLEEDATTEMKEYFDSVRTFFRNLHWPARNIAPVWHQGTRGWLYGANVSIAEGGRKDDKSWEWGKINQRCDEFAVLPRNEQVEGGAILWTWWNSERNTPSYQVTSGWTQVQFKDLRIISIDMAFLGNLPKQEDGRSPDSTPTAELGQHILVGLEQNTNALHVKTVVPEGKTAPTDLGGTLKAPPSNLKLRQVCIHVPDEGYQVYLLGESKGNANWDQIHLVTKDAITEFGPTIRARIDRIYVNKLGVWALGGQTISFRAHGAEKSAPWVTMENPDASFDLPKDWKYLGIHPGDDGLVLATIGERYFAWTPEDDWHSVAERGGYYFKVARLPLGGWQMFSATWEASKAWVEMANSSSGAAPQ